MIERPKRSLLGGPLKIVKPGEIGVVFNRITGELYPLLEKRGAFRGLFDRTPVVETRSILVTDSQGEISQVEVDWGIPQIGLFFLLPWEKLTRISQRIIGRDTSESGLLVPVRLQFEVGEPKTVLARPDLSILAQINPLHAARLIRVMPINGGSFSDGMATVFDELASVTAPQVLAQSDYTNVMTPEGLREASIRATRLGHIALQERIPGLQPGDVDVRFNFRMLGLPEEIEQALAVASAVSIETSVLGQEAAASLQALRTLGESEFPVTFVTSGLGLREGTQGNPQDLASKGDVWAAAQQDKSQNR